MNRLDVFRAVGLAAVACLAEPTRAQAPLSAIPWLSDSLERPAPTPPPVASSSDAALPEPSANGEIMVKPLASVSAGAVGLLPPELTGFPRALWGPLPAEEVRALVLVHDPSGAPEAVAVFHRIMLAEADPPAGDAEAVLLARVDRLLALGALEEARALLERAGASTPELFRQWFDVGLLLDEAEQPCAALEVNPALSPTLPARVFCLARGGDWSAAEITLVLGENVGSIAPEQERLLARFLDPELFEGETDPPIPNPLTPLDFLLREAVGLPRPSGPLPPAFVWGDLDPHMPMRVRIEAAERLNLAGAIDTERLFETYMGGAPAASGGVWDRARAWQDLDAAIASGAPESVAAALSAADATFAARGLRVALAESISDRLAGLPLAALPDSARTTAFELLLLAGQPEVARVVAPDSARAAALFALATGGAIPALQDGSAIAAALAAFADRPHAGQRETLLAGLVEVGRTGEAILAALDLTAAGPSDPSAFGAGLFGLVRAGQETAARRIALQSLLATPGARG